MTKDATADKPENPWINIGVNVILPAILLMKGDDLLRDRLGVGEANAVLGAFVLALLFPLGYGLRDLLVRRKWNFFSILGLISVLLMGGIGLLKLPPEWVAVKEAMVPAIIGLVVIGSHWIGRPLVEVFLFRPEIFEVEKIENRLALRGSGGEFERVLRKSNLWLAFSFGVSAVLNFVLARLIVRSDAGTEAFNDEIGRMTLLSYPVIVIPSLIITFYALSLILKGLKTHAGLELEEAIVDRRARASRDSETTE